MLYLLLIFFIYTIKDISCKKKNKVNSKVYSCKNNIKNINNDIDLYINEKKDSHDQKNVDIKKSNYIYNEHDNVSPFYWHDSNCEFKTALTEFNLLCLYIPEIIEKLKDSNNIIQNFIDINLKKSIVNEIINLHTRYKNFEKQIKVDKIIDLLKEIAICCLNEYNPRINKDYNDKLIEIISKLGEFKFIIDFDVFIELIEHILSDDCEISKKNEYIDEYNKKKNNKLSVNSGYQSNISLVEFINFLNKYVLKIFDEYEKKYILDKKSNNDIYNYKINNKNFKIYRIYNTITCGNKDVFRQIFNDNKVISFNIESKYSDSIDHCSCFVNYNEKYYYDSYNNYINVDYNDLKNAEFEKILSYHSKETFSTEFTQVCDVIFI